MSKLTDSFRRLFYLNQNSFYSRVDFDPKPEGNNPKREKGRVFITYSPQQTGRGGRAAAWVVQRVGYKTDSKAHWRDYGNKTFGVYGRQEKASKLAEAQAWAGAKYGIKEWAKDPYGGYGEASFVKERIKALKAAEAALKPGEGHGDPDWEDDYHEEHQAEGREVDDRCGVCRPELREVA